MAKRTPTSRKPAASRARKPAARKSPQRQPALDWSLRPEHQRELFALTLITVAGITIVFFLTGSSGAIGQTWVEFTQRLLGWGALLVPLALGLLGVAILWQERREDLQLTGATVLGTAMLLMSLLALLEFSLQPPRGAIDEQVGTGGGLVGFTLLQMHWLIGRPATFLIYCVLGLAGILLTFNITLYEIITGMRDSFARFWFTLWSAPERERPAQAAAMHAPPVPAGSEANPFVPPPGADDIVPTPIAARPTRASLFNRPEEKVLPKPAAKPEAPKPQPAAPAAAKPGPNTLLTDLLTKPAGAPADAAQHGGAVVQEPLDGFEVPAVHQAWPLPSYDLLEASVEGVISDDERRSKARLIEETLASFKVEAQVVGVNTGPAVTQFELQPAVGVKVSKITTLERDLALALSAHSIRIEAPIPGKAAIGIEIPNSAISVVSMRDVVVSDEFDAAKAKLKLPLGKDVSGTPIVTGLERMPHLLVAGSTGSGKSIAINCFVCALLLKYTPDELKLIMVDPKMVEMIIYNNIPHMLSPVVTELERVVPTLKWATREMERRYKIFAKHGFRNLDGYKAAARRRADLEPLPYIVIIIDELADLMMMAPDEVETLICRLAQMARATGIHLIIATQRPSVDVVTGLIKANFPSRIAFAVTSQIDSRVILDMNGAEQLLGRGDMLFMAPDAAKPIRVQGTYVSEAEVERIVSFWRNAHPPDQATGDRRQATAAAGKPANGKDGSPTPNPQPPTPALKGPGEFLSVDEQDELLPEAIKLVKQHQRASASLLQRRLRIGYSKAAQLIDLLEQQGIVGPAEDGRSREVLQSEDN
ncbi:MAG TPA: DNA translocase FtsK [Roseiflexaceae bacterium]|nr:DNA translocase FtsK [Roseiflexaceae bacterium]